MSIEELLKIQKCVLKVSIHCDGCKQKVKKILQKIDGVFKTEIDAEQGKVTVYGNVEPAILVKKLAKSGKHAELWPSQNPNHGDQVKNLQILNTGNAFPRPSKGGNEQTKNGGNALQLQQQLKELGQIRGLQDLKLPPPMKDLNLPSKDQNPNKKSNKIELQDDDDDDDDFSDYDDLDDYGDEDYEDEEDDEDYEDEEDDDDIEEEVQIPQKGGNGKKDGKNQNGGTKAGGISNLNQAGAAGRNGSETGGAKMSSNGGGAFNNKVDIDNKNGVHAIPISFQTLGAPHGGRMGNNPTVQRLPATAMNGGGGWYPHSSGPESMARNPNNQQQYIEANAMMNQQRAMANQPIMYVRPPAAVNYMPAYSFPTSAIPTADPYTHYFSDENTSSCNVM